MNKKKILITGFPHTGTTILKCKLGESQNLYEFPYELDFLRPIELANKGDKEFTLIKSPAIPIEIKKYGLAFLPESIYKDYNIIFVTRNPWNLFTSIYKSGEDPLNNPTYHLEVGHVFRIEEYFTSLKLFKEAQTGNFPNVYAIKYEDFFTENNIHIKKIMDDIGLVYTNDIFENKTKEYVGFSNVHLKDVEPNSLDIKNRPKYRTWQINQPFKNMNGEVNIPNELDNILKNSNIIKELGYSDPRLTY